MILETKQLILDYIDTTVDRGLVIKFKVLDGDAYPIFYFLPKDVSYVVTSDGSTLQDHICTYDLYKEFVMLLDQADWLFEKAYRTTLAHSIGKDI